ncbi:putative lipase-like protein [Hapsidospora chrysogenum ATCC 11550]|uniref:Putative lipase-like protein n=1 Tax=Hapsidospora chrysogenum (strain ATCC 11550 / CBS 779.69 / DSM 880 / IAM 14645 / JCM 23072 / IMI 49137) TaxID=857340 RepID=A0A086T0Q8_HAPC1|nr:putative lipase-like protein [Hapsidospora chrysogenum ATCC 11550]
MLLIHQTGSLKVGEVVRYTVTYIPSQDRILPSPERLYVRIRNTSAIALRAAFVHGPYTLSVAAYPAGFDPNEKFDRARSHGVPEFEPMVKAGGSWGCELVVPEAVRQGAGTGSHGGFGKGPEHDHESATWVIEVSSQVIFSTSAAVGFEVLVARDPKSLNLGVSLPVVSSQSQVPQPGKLADYQQSVGAKDGHHPAQPGGVFSRAVQLKVEDTATLWNTPRLPSWDDKGDERVKHRSGADKPVESMVDTGDPETKQDAAPPRKPKKVHLVVLTHGLHSNLGADMLFMKESIDAAAKQAKIDAKARRARARASKRRSTPSQDRSDENKEEDAAPNSTADDGPEEDEDDEEEDDDEEVIVRGYSGNATRTERGIKYLGKRLARYVLSMTYPDQPFLPLGKDAAHNTASALKSDVRDADIKPAHKGSTIHGTHHHHHQATEKRPYNITSISFIAHSLGGLVQTYAVAYIQKHSPQFFDLIKPINFISLATPWLGLSNENPVYVKFALDFGLVGRTGKDLGLTWRAPTLARSGWGAIVGNLGETAHKKVYGESQPESKPLLRILPTGPAHTALKKFRNRTVYSNVVNDGIVPLRTSCLLFLDWQGLGRVEKARRDAGLVETMVGFGWAELTGTTMASMRQRQLMPADEQPCDSGTTTPKNDMSQVPQPASDAVEEDERRSIGSLPAPFTESGQQGELGTGSPGLSGPLSGFFNLFRNTEAPKEQPITQKQKKIYDMSQTRHLEEGSSSTVASPEAEPRRPAKVTSGSDLGEDTGGLNAPPRTTFFEAAGDLLNPKIPDVEYIVDPSKRPRTIFHDRVYHPSDIPAPPMKRRQTSVFRKKSLSRTSSWSQSSTLVPSSGTPSSPGSLKSEESKTTTRERQGTLDSVHSRSQPEEVVDVSHMRVEEKIARAYHRDLAWRKVLVKLEPDAHNNIFVRRMFVNAYGWPVVKHLVDAHFSDSAVARMRTEDEYLGERALDVNQPPDVHGGETKGVPSSGSNPGPEPRRDSESGEARDRVPDLPPSQRSQDGHSFERGDSATWSDRDWADSEYESDMDFGPDAVKAEGRDWNWTEKIVGKGGLRKVKSPPPKRVEQ